MEGDRKKEGGRKREEERERAREGECVCAHARARELDLFACEYFMCGWMNVRQSDGRVFMCAGWSHFNEECSSFLVSQPLTFFPSPITFLKPVTIGLKLEDTSEQNARIAVARLDEATAQWKEVHARRGRDERGRDERESETKEKYVYVCGKHVDVNRMGPVARVQHTHEYVYPLLREFHSSFAYIRMLTRTRIRTLVLSMCAQMCLWECTAGRDEYRFGDQGSERTSDVFFSIQRCEDSVAH